MAVWGVAQRMPQAAMLDQSCSYPVGRKRRMHG